jgi:hypothetical protein
VIGIWSEFPAPLSWQAEGIMRLVGMLIEGAAACDDATICVVVSPANEVLARAAFRTLAATEERHWRICVVGLTEPDGPAAAPASMAAAGPAPNLLRRLLRPAWRWLWRTILRDLHHGWHRRRRARTMPPAPASAEAIPAPPPPPPWSPDVEGVAAAVGADGWLVLMPHFTLSQRLPGRRVVLFPDAIPVDFPSGWPEACWQADGLWAVWDSRVRATLATADAVITFSEHVARRHLVDRFGVPRARIHPIHHAAEDRRSVLSCLPPDRRRTLASRAAAAAMLRRHAAERGWWGLADYPFEHVDIIMVSTQDRPNKNLRLAAEAVLELIREARMGIRLVTASGQGNPGSPFQRFVRERRLGPDALLLHDLPPDIHAALYHCAALTIHPAFFEGGTFPFPESVSLGTPCLAALGPHTEDLLSAEPEIARYLFDPYDAAGLARLIRAGLAARDEMLTAQLAIHARLARRSVGAVARDYIDVILDRLAIAVPAADALASDTPAG